MNRREFQRHMIGAALCAAVGGPLLKTVPQTFAEDPLCYQNPQGVAADPSILRKPTGEIVEYDGKYWLYYTSEKGGVYGYKARSTRDFVTWEDEGLSLTQGTWARRVLGAEGYELDGKYYLFFKRSKRPVSLTQAEKFNIGIAVADSPKF